MSHNATLEKTGDEDCMIDGGHVCPTEAYNQRRMFFHGCVSDIYIPWSGRYQQGR